ncbi:MAG: hypothetical protein V9E89_12385 [Ilumatobacteraceae bacterium]
MSSSPAFSSATSCTGGLVASDDGIVTTGHHAAQITQVELGKVTAGGIGAVQPLGHSQARQQLLGHGDQSSCRDLVLAGGLQLGVLLLDGLANGGDPALQRPFGNRPLGLGKLGQHGIAVGSAGLEPLGLRSRRQLRRWRERRAGAALGPLVAVTTVCRSVTAGRSITTIRTVATVRAIGAPAAGPVAAVTARGARAVTALATVAARAAITVSITALAAYEL